MSVNSQLEIEFCERVASLHNCVESWLADPSLSFQREEVQLAEEAVGTYSSQKLVVAEKGRVVATFVPIGASVIGADGRVDVRGRYDNESLLFLTAPGPSLTSTAGELPPHSRFYFNDINTDGWYWVENTLRGRAHLLDETLLRDLLWRVSDYESN